MEDYAIDIIIGRARVGNSIQLDLPRFTRWRDRAGQRPQAPARPLRRAAAAGAVHPGGAWPHRHTLSGAAWQMDIDPSGAGEIASRSRGTPRIANRMLRRVRDFAQLYLTASNTREA